MNRIVLDTNCLLISLSKQSQYFPIWEGLFDGKYTLCVTTEILAEYEEIITQKTNKHIAQNVISAIINNKNVEKMEVYYKFELIKADPTDNKFVDCAIKAQAKYIVTNDHHFDILREIPFPHIDIVDIDNFLKELTSNK